MSDITREDLVIALCDSHGAVTRAQKLACRTCIRRAHLVLELEPEHRISSVLRMVFNTDHGHTMQRGNARCSSCINNVARTLDAIARKKFQEDE